jgi:NADPH:quinone reductase-like Zn-dependent oxidoreductase
MILRALQTGVGEPHEVLQLAHLELPPPGPGEVRVRVLAAAINPADFLRCRGVLGGDDRWPAACGGEGVGRVEQLGAGVVDLEPGRLVLLPSGEAWTEALVAPAGALVPLPEVDPLQAAMLAINPATAALLLSAIVPLQPGDWVLHDAANSAVGRLICRLARARGLHTVGVVRRESATAEVLAAGADAALVDGPEFAVRVAAATRGAPIRLALDAVGGDTAGRLTACLAFGGTLVVYGVLGGGSLHLSAARVAFHGITVRGFSRRAALTDLGPAGARAFYAELAAELGRGTITSEVEATYPLRRLHAAMAHAERDARAGKILLVMDPALAPAAAD